MCHTCLIVSFSQSDVVRGSDGTKVPLVRYSRFVALDVAAMAAPADPRARAPSVSNASLTTLKRIVEMLSNSDEKRGTTRSNPPFRDSVVTTLVAEAFGGTWRNTVIGTVSPHFAQSSDTAATLRFVASCGTIRNSPKPSGGTAANVILDLQRELGKLKSELHGDVDGRPVSPQVGLKEEIDERERALCELQTTANRAVEKYERMQAQLIESQEKAKSLAKEKDAVEVEKRSVETQLTSEKQKAFAAAFRNAFIVGRQQEERKVALDDAEKQLQHAKEKNDKLNVQLTAAKGERDRFQFDFMKTEKELKRVQHEHSMLQAHASKIQKELYASQDECEAVTSKLSLAKFEATNEIHELRTQLLNSERERDALRLEIESKNKELAQEHERSQQRVEEAKNSAAKKITQLEDDLEAERAENIQLRREASRASEAATAAKSEKEKMQAEFSSIRQSDVRGEADLQKDVARERAKYEKLLQQHEIEREGYAAMLSEGRSFLAELRQYEALLLGRPSMYRASRTGIAAWLELNGLGMLCPALEAAGFDDVYAISNIQEKDLLEMKVLTGTRRKFLAAAAALKAELQRVGATNSAVAATPQRSASSASTSVAAASPAKVPNVSVRKLLDELYSWFNDFDLSITAEAEASPARIH